MKRSILPRSLFVAAALVLSTGRFSLAIEPPADRSTTANQRVVQAYMDAFNLLDHGAVLALLADDVEWIVPGAFHVTGKPAFDQQIENDAFVGRPAIKVTRMFEDKQVVVAEGTVQATRKQGGTLNLVFCDVFELNAKGQIKRLTSYLMETKAAPP